MGGHCLSPAPPISRGRRLGGGGGALHVRYYTGREHRVGGALHVRYYTGRGHGVGRVPFCIGRGRGVGGATPRPLLLAGVNYKIM